MSLQVNATQPDGDQLIYDDGGTLPSGLTIDSLSGVISGTVAAGAASSYNVTLTATDNTDLNNQQTVSQSFAWTVNTLHNPVVTSPGSQTNAAGDVVSLQVAATDAPGNTLAYGATGLPDGLSIDPGSGIISGTIQNDAAQSTPYQVTATVTDGTAGASQTFPWTVNTVGVANPGDQYNLTGDAVSLPITGVDAAYIPLTFSATGLPQGLSIDSGTGVISGTIAATAATGQPDAVTVSATDGQNSGSTAFAWNVAPLTLADRTDVEGASVTLQTPPPASSDGALTFSATGLPSGESIDSTTGVISGTIALGDSAGGPYAVNVTMTDAEENSSSQGFNWTIHPAENGAPTLAAPANQTTVAGTQVSLNLSAGDSDEDVLTYSATGLPDGLSIDPDLGVISGVPAEDAIQSTPYTVTATVDDGDGATASQTFNWTVTDSSFTLNGMPISQTEGAGVQTFDVATFYDPDANRAPSDYAATINWGDGQSSPGTVDGTAGEDTVSGDHVYLHPGNFTVQVSVTDPDETTVSSTATAAVAAAPLTATGDFVDGTLTGATTALTVAAFTDANTYDAAGSYTATITWGDGTTSAGVVTGADGEFTVGSAPSGSASHAYQHDGTYTVGVTIRDADGTTTTATSTVTAGDLYAGVPETLTAASFTAEYANEPASDFTAAINWGDGSAVAGGVVTPAAGGFAVAGTHAYGAAGYYTVQATVWDHAGHTLTASATVLAAPGPAAASAGALASTAGGGLNNAPLALFALPPDFGSSGPYTATEDWGDGTTSAVSLVNVGDVLEVWGGHAYASMGQYAVRTLLYNAAGTLQAAAVAWLLDAPTPLSPVEGPAVVPGNSVYQYQINLSSPVNPNDINPNWSTEVNGATGRAVHIQNAQGQWTGFQVTLTFPNKPEVVTMALKNLLNGSTPGTITTSFQVIVVEVDVKAPAAATAFQKPGTPSSQSFISNPPGDIPIDGKTYDKGVKGKIFASYVGKVHNTDLEPTPALNAAAQVTLTGPGANLGVDKIMVGFVQHVTVSALNVTFKSGAVLVSSLQSAKAYLDSSADSSPYMYRNNEEAGPGKPPLVSLLTGKSGVITVDDGPGAGWVPLTFPLSNPVDVATSIAIVQAFMACPHFMYQAL